MIALVAYSSGLARYRRFVRTVVALTVVAAVAWGLTPWYGLTFNMSTSLPGTLYFIRKGPCRPRLGDTIAFRWHGGATYPAGLTFIKHVAGLPGDVVHVVGRKRLGQSDLYRLRQAALACRDGAVSDRRRRDSAGTLLRGHAEPEQPRFAVLDRRHRSSNRNRRGGL